MGKKHDPGVNPSSPRWGGDVAAPSRLAEQKRQAILHAAATLFNERGFQGTSLADVAERLGVTKQALYYYFKDKQTLLFACHLRISRVARVSASQRSSHSRWRPQASEALAFNRPVACLRMCTRQLFRHPETTPIAVAIG